MKNQPAYPMPVVRTQGQRPRHLDDPGFAMRAISLASTGMSRVGVASQLGVSYQVLYVWLERGRAEPSRAPWGPFAEAYLRAERGLERAGATALSLRVQMVLVAQQRFLEWYMDGAKGVPPTPPSLAECEFVLRVIQSRYPAEHGATALRQPEIEPSGEAWLERTGMQHEQLVTMLRDPPEPVALALVAAGYVRVDAAKPGG